MRVFIKVCGITSKEDGLSAVAMGADALGFVFAPSPRQIDRATSADITARLPRGVLTVGVFQNQDKENVVKIADKVSLKAVQLHGNETPEETKWIKDRVPYVIKGFTGGSEQLINAKDWQADIVLIDAPVPGSGKVFDWEQADNAPSGIKIMLAGGLTANNVGDAIKRVRPWGVDVSTGVEISRESKAGTIQKGKKDPIAIKEFVAAVAEASENLSGNNSPEEEGTKTNHNSMATDSTSDEHLPDKQPYDWEADLL